MNDCSLVWCNEFDFPPYLPKYSGELCACVRWLWRKHNSMVRVFALLWLKTPSSPETGDSLPKKRLFLRHVFMRCMSTVHMGSGCGDACTVPVLKQSHPCRDIHRCKVYCRLNISTRKRLLGSRWLVGSIRVSSPNEFLSVYKRCRKSLSKKEYLQRLEAVTCRLHRSRPAHAQKAGRSRVYRDVQNPKHVFDWLLLCATVSKPFVGEHDAKSSDACSRSSTKDNSYYTYRTHLFDNRWWSRQLLSH